MAKKQIGDELKKGKNEKVYRDKRDDWKGFLIIVILCVLALFIGSFVIEKQATKDGLINQGEPVANLTAPYPSRMTGVYGYMAGDTRTS